VSILKTCDACKAEKCALCGKPILPPITELDDRSLELFAGGKEGQCGTTADFPRGARYGSSDKPLVLCQRERGHTGKHAGNTIIRFKVAWAQGEKATVVEEIS
jgi:hypothetical protein